MRITTVRHGETDWNVARRAQGSMDIPLNKTGENQARLLSERLKNEPCDIIYASDLQRAKKTAEIINGYHNKELIATDRLRESSFGKFEGTVLTDPVQREAFGEFMNERAPAYFKQVSEYLDEIIHAGHKNVFIVAHFGTIRAIICYFLKIPPEDRARFYIGNTALHTFEMQSDGSFEMTLENDTRHLWG